jgi:hypothetical protein
MADGWRPSGAIGDTEINPGRVLQIWPWFAPRYRKIVSSQLPPFAGRTPVHLHWQTMPPPPREMWVEWLDVGR